MHACCAGGSCADVGSPTCTHLVVEERNIKNLPADIQGRPVVVTSEVVQFIISAKFNFSCVFFLAVLLPYFVSNLTFAT